MQKIDNSKNNNLKEVYTDHKGNKWYGYINPLEISAIRGIAAQRADRYVALMISEKELTLLIEEQEKAAKAMDVVRVYAIIYEIKTRLKMLCEENSLLDLAGIYYFLKDEDPDMPSPSHDEKKRLIWEADPACRAFFLLKGIEHTEKLKNIPPADSLKFLEKAKGIAEKIYTFIPRPSQR